MYKPIFYTDCGLLLYLLYMSVKHNVGTGYLCFQYEQFDKGTGHSLAAYLMKLCGCLSFRTWEKELYIKISKLIQLTTWSWYPSASELAWLSLLTRSETKAYITGTIFEYFFTYRLQPLLCTLCLCLTSPWRSGPKKMLWQLITHLLKKLHWFTNFSQVLSRLPIADCRWWVWISPNNWIHFYLVLTVEYFYIMFGKREFKN